MFCLQKAEKLLSNKSRKCLELPKLCPTGDEAGPAVAGYEQSGGEANPAERGGGQQTAGVPPAQDGQNHQVAALRTVATSCWVTVDRQCSVELSVTINGKPTIPIKTSKTRFFYISEQISLVLFDGCLQAPHCHPASLPPHRVSSGQHAFLIILAPL